MFGQTFSRVSRVASSQFRRYATENAPQSGGGRGILYAGVAAAGAGGAYYYLNSGAPIPTAAVKSALPAKKIFTGGDQGFVSLPLSKVETINHNTKRLRFSLGDDNAISGVDVASALITKVKPEGAEKPVIRPYTPVSDEDARGYLDFIIKRYEGGPMSSHMHDMKEGDELAIKGPIPKYRWETNKHSHIGLVAGGTGITPMWQLCRAVFNNPEDKTKITMVYGSVTEDDIILKDEIQQLEKKYPDRFRAFMVLDKPPAGWTQGKGYVTKELLKTVLPAPQDENGNVKVFVCGPPGLYKAVSGGKKSPQDQGELSGYLQDLGFQKDQVYKF